MGLTSRIQLRVSPAELDIIDGNADSLGISRSAFIRFIATAPLTFSVADGSPAASGQIILLDTKTMRDIYREHNRQGVNLNQMAHAANAFNAKSWLKPGQADELLAVHAKALREYTSINAHLLDRIDRISSCAFSGLGR